MSNIRIVIIAEGESQWYSLDDNLNPFTMDSARKTAINLMKKYGDNKIVSIYRGKQRIGFVRYIVPTYYYKVQDSSDNCWYPIHRDGSINKSDKRHIPSEEMMHINRIGKYVPKSYIPISKRKLEL
jgi:hypothetical protein